MKGMIVNPESPLVKFQVETFAHGGEIIGDELPFVVWVNRNHTKDLCPSGKPAYMVHRETSDYRVNAMRPGFSPAVCGCMGRFAE
jgi:hypothetical protein